MLENRFSTHSKTLQHTHCRALQHTWTHSNAPSFHCAHVYMLIHRRNLHLLIGLLVQWYLRTGARQNMYVHNICRCTIYIYMFTCIYVHRYTCIYIYINMYIYAYIQARSSSCTGLHENRCTTPHRDSCTRFSFIPSGFATQQGSPDTSSSSLIFSRFYVYLCIREWVCMLIRTWIPSYPPWFFPGSMCIYVYMSECACWYAHGHLLILLNFFQVLCMCVYVYLREGVCVLILIWICGGYD